MECVPPSVYAETETSNIIEEMGGRLTGRLGDLSLCDLLHTLDKEQPAPHVEMAFNAQASAQRVSLLQKRQESFGSDKVHSRRKETPHEPPAIRAAAG